MQRLSQRTKKRQPLCRKPREVLVIVLQDYRDCQARAKAKLDFHFNASLSAVTFAKLEAHQQNSNCDQAFSMASLKRRAFNPHLIDRICEHLANGQSLEKSSPDYETLCNYGIIADEAA